MIAHNTLYPTLPVSQDIAAKLQVYEQLLKKWQKAINLVGPSTLGDVAGRHFMDSIQLIDYIEKKDISLADIGSGAGFPGMVLAILGIKDVHLVESDTRKAVFLQTVSRETNTPVTIYNTRIEDCKLPPIDTLTARALASLDDLLGFTIQITPRIALFLKGARLDEEVAVARKKWAFDCKIYGGIIEISNLKKLS